VFPLAWSSFSTVRGSCSRPWRPTVATCPRQVLGTCPRQVLGTCPRQVFRRELVHRAAVSGPEVTAPAGYRGSACRRRLGTAVADDGRAMVAGGLVRPGGRNARVRTRVVWALLVELGDRPFDTVTMSGLATRSGIARATLHRRWGDPGAVLADAADDLLQRRMGRGIGTISRAAPDPRPSSTDLLVVPPAQPGHLALPTRDVSRAPRRDGSDPARRRARGAHGRTVGPRAGRPEAGATRTVPAATERDIERAAESLLGAVVVRVLLRHRPTGRTGCPPAGRGLYTRALVGMPSQRLASGHAPPTRRRTPPRQPAAASSSR